MPAQARALPNPLGAPLRTDEQEAHRRTLRARLQGAVDAAARQPYRVIAHVRVLLSLALTALCLATLAGALLFLMAWRQSTTSGLLASQTDRMWDVWGHVARFETYAAGAAGALAIVWIAVAALNVRRATGRRRNPFVAAAMMAIGIAGCWFAAQEFVLPGLADDDLVRVLSGIGLQVVAAAFPLFALERLADAAEARHRPGRVAVVMALAFVVVIQISGGVSTIDRTDEFSSWGREGALVLIAALIEIIAALALSEAGRALEEGTQHRYELRHRFGESVLLQIGA